MRQTVRAELGLIAVAAVIATTLSLLAPPQKSVGGLDRIDLAMPTSTELTTDQVFVRLTIDPARTGENALIVYATQGTPNVFKTGTNGEQVLVHQPPLNDVQAARIDLTSLDLPIAPRSIELQPKGEGRFRAEGINFSADGWWRAVVTIRRVGVAEDEAAEFVLKTPDPNVSGFPSSADTGDPAAADAYARARDQFATQTWTVSHQAISGGDGGVEISQQIWSNGGIKITLPGLELIRIGGKRYLRNQGNQWQATEDTEPGGPAGEISDLEGATDFHFGTVETVDGRPAQVIHFFVPERFLAPAYYTWWVDVETGQVLRQAMISRSHYMLKRYDWSAPPEKLVPPV
jgi:hypothetical protein